MNTVRTVSLIACSLLLASCLGKESRQPLPSDLKPLTAAQLQALVEGSSMSLTGYGQTASVDFTSDGTMTGSNRAGEKDTGQWKVLGEELCMRFKKWGSGDTICYQVVEHGNGSYELYNRKGMPVFDLSVIKEGGSAVAQVETRATQASSPAAPQEAPQGVESLPPPPPESPHAADDVNFIIRHNAQNCPGCNLAHADLSGQSLIGANLQGANLTEANLSHANLRRANLKGANLYRADLRGADLSGTDLTGANLTEALLK